MGKQWTEKQRVAQRTKIHKRRLELLNGKSCVRCGFDNPKALEFHHIDPTTKVDSVIRMILLSYDKLQAEVAKCEIICANCHAIEHSTKDWDK